MKKSHFFAVLVSIGVLLVASQAAAAEEKYSVQIGVVADDISISGSPINADVKSNSASGANITFVYRDPLYPMAEYTVGLSKSKYDIGLVGASSVKLAQDCAAVSATARYRIADVQNNSPVFYVGGGLHSASCDSSTGSSLKMQSYGMAGLVAEAGVRVNFDRRIYGDLNIRQYFGSTSDLRMETASGNALLTRVQMRDPTAITLSVGMKFD